MKLLTSLFVLYVLFAAVIILSKAEEHQDIDKRYLAALAKNGRLPKFSNAQKKNQPQEPHSSEKEDAEEDYSKEEDKRHMGAFLRVRGKPNFMRPNSFTEDSNRDGKRNVASMARLGRLNAFRFARLQPYNVGGKRMSSEETSNNNEENLINAFEDPDCIETDDGNYYGGDERPIWMQKKRYVAALARSGRLPSWHSQRMYVSGKRDDSIPFWPNTSFQDEGENALNFMPFTAGKNKRCKKVYDYQTEKRNVAALAKNGKLPFRTNA